MTSKTVNARSGSSDPRTGSDCPLDTRLLMGGTSIVDAATRAPLTGAAYPAASATTSRICSATRTGW